MRPSHQYDFSLRDVLRHLAPPLVVVAVLACLIHAGALFALWPGPWPALDMDRTLLAHQIKASRDQQTAQVILLGDSSCLMNVSANDLTRLLGVEVLNLGTLSYLDLRAAGHLLSQYAAANPGRVRVVVLLMHPETLRRPAPDGFYVELFQRLMDAQDAQTGTGPRALLLRVLGLDKFQTRILARILPSPLPGAYARVYGFTSALDRYLAEHRGSAVEADHQPFSGNAEYKLAPSWESTSRDFAGVIPPGARLFVGITPVPAGFVERDYSRVRDEMLTTWGKWLNADRILMGLPAALPDHDFAKTTHLRPNSVHRYTARLADALVGRGR